MATKEGLPRQFLRDFAGDLPGARAGALRGPQQPFHKA